MKHNQLNETSESELYRIISEIRESQRKDKHKKDIERLQYFAKVATLALMVSAVWIMVFHLLSKVAMNTSSLLSQVGSGF